MNYEINGFVLMLNLTSKKTVEISAAGVKFRWKGETAMPEVQSPMTALETRFEDELAVLPGWHHELEKIEHAKNAQRPKETVKDKIFEESMILGV